MNNMLHDQGKIIHEVPKLPVPDLQESLERYLLCVKPVVSKQQFETTQRIVEEFGANGGIGQKLHEKLKKFAHVEDNWAYKWWLNEMYYDNRAALPVNSNPGMWLERLNFANSNDRLRFTSRLIVAILEYNEILENKKLPRDVARGQLAGQTLCMKQYYRLMSTYRAPGKDRDYLKTFERGPAQTKYCLIAVKGQFFLVPTTKSDGSKCTASDFYHQLVHTETMASNATTCNVGLLTSLPRNEWANCRDMLMKIDVSNEESLSSIEQSLFVICLDGTVNNDFSDAQMARLMLHGCGSKHNSANRWYDKTIQFVIGESGEFGLVYEHSPAEGIAVISLVEHVTNSLKQSVKQNSMDSGCNTNLMQVKNLTWKVDKEISSSINKAGKFADKLAQSLDIRIFRFSKYGKSFIKKQNVSPDAFIQVILQLAYYKIYGHLVSTYESASTRRFLNGRVDNIRGATVQALDFVRSVTEPDVSGVIKMDNKKMILFERAIKAQSDYTIAAITGHGIDCHLSALREIATEECATVPEIFTDASYEIANQFKLSTSQVPTKSEEAFMCYGPVVPDGYGVSYNPHDSNIVFCVASLNTCCTTSSEKFESALFESLQLVAGLCRRWRRRRSSSLENIALPRMRSIYRELIYQPHHIEEDIRSNSSLDINGNETKENGGTTHKLNQDKGIGPSKPKPAFWRKALSVDLFH